jgi:hypothetical protein
MKQNKTKTMNDLSLLIGFRHSLLNELFPNQRWWWCRATANHLAIKESDIEMDVCKLTAARLPTARRYFSFFPG